MLCWLAGLNDQERVGAVCCCKRQQNKSVTGTVCCGERTTKEDVKTEDSFLCTAIF